MSYRDSYNSRGRREGGYSQRSGGSSYRYVRCLDGTKLCSLSCGMCRRFFAHHLVQMIMGEIEIENMVVSVVEVAMSRVLDGTTSILLGKTDLTGKTSSPSKRISTKNTQMFLADLRYGFWSIT